MSKSIIKLKISSEESLLTRLRKQRELIKRSTLPTQENQENLIKIRTDPTVKDTRLYLKEDTTGSNTTKENDFFNLFNNEGKKKTRKKTINRRTGERKFTQQPRRIDCYKFVRNRIKSKTERINNKNNFEEQLEELLKNKGCHTDFSYVPSEIKEKTDSPNDPNDNMAENIENNYFVKEIENMESMNKAKLLIDPQKFSYEIIKNYSQIKIGKDADFIERMQFDVYKRHSKEKRMKLLFDKHKPKINEAVRVEAFNRLINDANRRIEVQENLNINKIALEQQEIDHTSQKKYKVEEWSNIYKDRFHKFEEKRREKIEKVKKEQEMMKLKEEEKIISQVNRKKLTSENLKDTFDRLYKYAEVLKIKNENKVKEIEEDKRVIGNRGNLKLKKKKKNKPFNHGKIIKDNNYMIQTDFNISAEVSSPKGKLFNKIKNEMNNPNIMNEECKSTNEKITKNLRSTLKENVDRIVSQSKNLETSCNSNNDEQINLKDFRKINLKASPSKKQQCNLKYKYLSESEAKKFMDNLFLLK